MGRTSGGDCALVPTGYEATGYTCVRSLGRQGIDTIVASESRGVPAAASKYCTESVQVASPREEWGAYRDDLLELARRDEVRTVLPVRAEDGYLLSRYYDQFTDHVSLVAPPMSQMRTVHDRLALARAAEAAGVPVPETRRLSDVDTWDGDLLVKTRYSVLSEEYVDGVERDSLDVVKDRYHVSPDSAPDRETIRETMGHDPIVQEFVPKDGEYMFAGLYDHGDPLATFQHRQIRGDSYTGGGGVYRKSVDIPELDAVARDLLEHLDWHGLACIEYMKDGRTGEFVLTEINPRLWQSLPSTVRAGADFPYYYWLQANGRCDEITDGYDLGVGSHQLTGEVGYLRSVLSESSPHVSRPSVPTEIWAIVSSCLREPAFDYLALDDPRPFIAGLRSFIANNSPAIR